MRARACRPKLERLPRSRRPLHVRAVIAVGLAVILVGSVVVRALWLRARARETSDSDDETFRAFVEAADGWITAQSTLGDLQSSAEADGDARAGEDTAKDGDWER